jgi:hypothetical protein
MCVATGRSLVQNKAALAPVGLLLQGEKKKTQTQPKPYSENVKGIVNFGVPVVEGSSITLKIKFLGGQKLQARLFNSDCHEN